MEKIIMETPGVEFSTAISGYSMLSGVTNTYSGFFFITLKPWEERKTPEEKYDAIMAHLNREFGKLPRGVAFAFSPPAIPGIGTSGGVTMVIEDRSGKDIAFLWENTQKFLAEARKRPELARVTTTFSPTVPQTFVNVDRDKVLKLPDGRIYTAGQALENGLIDSVGSVRDAVEHAKQLAGIGKCRVVTYQRPMTWHPNIGPLRRAG